MCAQGEGEGAWCHVWGMQRLECLSEPFRSTLWGYFRERHTGNRSLIIPGFVVGLNFILMGKERVLRREAARSEMCLRKLILPGEAHHLRGRPEVERQDQVNVGTAGEGGVG